MNFKNKKGGLGSFIVMWIATISIVIILFLFIWGADLVKRISEVNNGVSVPNEDKIGLENVKVYFDNYFDFREAKRYFGTGKSLDKSLEAAKYVW